MSHQDTLDDLIENVRSFQYELNAEDLHAAVDTVGRAISVLESVRDDLETEYTVEFYVSARVQVRVMATSDDDAFEKVRQGEWDEEPTLEETDYDDILDGWNYEMGTV